MKIQTKKVVEDRKYYVSIYTSDFSEVEELRMVNYGEPDISMGGVIGLAEYPVTYRKLKTGSPFKFVADGRDYALDSDAETAADEWAAEIITRIKAAVDAIRSLDDTFTEESLETY